MRHTPAPQPMQRLAAGLAEGVPHRHLDSAHGHHRGALVMVVAGAQHVPIEGLGLVHRLADRERHHDSVEHRGNRVEEADGLAHAADTAGGVDLDDEPHRPLRTPEPQTMGSPNGTATRVRRTATMARSERGTGTGIMGRSYLIFDQISTRWRTVLLRAGPAPATCGFCVRQQAGCRARYFPQGACDAINEPRIRRFGWSNH